MNLELILLVGSSCALFILGTWLVPSIRFGHSPGEHRNEFAAGLLVISQLALILNIISVLRGNPDIVELLILQEGWQLKQRDEIVQSFGLAPPVMQAALWWFIFHFESQNKSSSLWSRWIFPMLVGIGMVLFIISATLRLSRGDTIPFLVGTGIAAAFRFTRKNPTSLATQLTWFAAGAVGIIVVFGGFSLLRGADSLDVLLADLVGYTVASFNRLAALLEGQMRFLYGGTGVYFSGFLSFNESFNRFIPFATWLDLPTFNEMWESEFDAVARAGLNENLIWATAFGYLFSEVGWLTPLLFLPYGFIAQLAWKGVQQGTPVGVTAYPWIAFCILFWLGTNFLLDTKFFVVLLVGLLIHFLDQLKLSSK